MLAHSNKQQQIPHFVSERGTALAGPYMNCKAVLPPRRRDCDSIKEKVDRTLASRHRIVVALVGEAPLRTEGSISRRLFFLIESQSRRLSGRTA
jgi:hypothetical protein